MVDRLCDFVVPYQHGLETHLNLTVGEGVAQLATLCALEVRVPGQEPFWRVPKPRGTSQRLLEAIGVQLPGFSANNAPGHGPQKAPQSLAGASWPRDAKGQSAH